MPANSYETVPDHCFFKQKIEIEPTAPIEELDSRILLISPLIEENDELIKTLTQDLLDQTNCLQQASGEAQIKNLSDLERLIYGENNLPLACNFFKDGTFYPCKDKGQEKIINAIDASIQAQTKPKATNNTSTQTAQTQTQPNATKALTGIHWLIHHWIIQPLKITWVIKPKLQQLQALHIVKNQLTELQNTHKKDQNFESLNTATKKISGTLDIFTNADKSHSVSQPFSTFHAAEKEPTGGFLIKAQRLVSDITDALNIHDRAIPLKNFSPKNNHC